MIIRRQKWRALLVCPELPLSYLSTPRLSELTGCKHLAPPLGLLTVAALLPSSWEIRLVDENVRDLTEMDWDQADLVLFSAMLIQWQSLEKLISQAKARGKLVVVGGPLASSRPEELLTLGVDFVVQGEAENTLPVLLAALEAGQTQRVIAAQDKPDLAATPIPRYDLIRLSDYQVMAVQTCRGCPFDCEFCDVVKIYGRIPRYKTPQKVTAELETLYRLGWRDYILIVDDNFIGAKKHAREMLAHITSWQALRGEPFCFWTQVSVNLAQDQDLIDRLTAANFSHVLIGVESPDPEVLKAVHKNQNVSQPLVESLITIRDGGLTIVGSFIMGFDHEKPGVGERIAALVDAAALPNVMVFLLGPIPNTRLWFRLKKEGRLLEEQGGIDRHALMTRGLLGLTLTFQPTRPAAQIMEEYKRLWQHLADRAQLLSRTYRFFLAMRPTRAAQAKARGLPLPSPAVLQKSISWRKKLGHFNCFCWLVWRQGIRSSSRLQFWTQLFSLLRRNPSRVINYFHALSLGEEISSMWESTERQLATLETMASRNLPEASQAAAAGGE